MSMELIQQSALAPIRELKLEDRIKLDPDAIAVRDEMLATITKACPSLVTNPAEQKTVKMYAVELNKWLKMVEDNQDEINRILLPLQRKSRRLTDEASAPVEAALKSLKMRLTGFTLREEERVAREEAERQRAIKVAQDEVDRLASIEAERQRLEREKQAAIQAKADRLAREAAEAAANARNKKEREESDALLRKSAIAQAKADAKLYEEELRIRKAEALLLEAQERERAAIVAQPVAASRQVGLVGGKKKVWSLQSDLEAIHRLYAHNRALVRMEPNAAAIQLLCFPEIPTPGLDVKWERKTDIRST